MVSQQHTEKEAVGSKRHCVTRRSTSSIIDHEEPTVITEDEQPTGSVVVANEPGCEEERIPYIVRSRRRPSKSQSLGSSMVSQPHTEKEVAVSKRRCVRRRSTSSGLEHEEPPTENLFEIDKAKFPIHEDGLSNLLRLSTKKLVFDGNSGGSKYEVGESRRMSIGRPSHKAAEKVQSYKEKPVSVKMRRPE